MSPRGRASGQRVHLSMAVRQYRNPEETDSGPTMSICTWEKRAVEISKFPRGAFTCHVTLDSWQGVHASAFTPFRPHKPLGHQFDSGVGPGVAKAVESVKKLASEWHCYKWPPLWERRVAVDIEIRPGNVHRFQSKPGTILQNVL